MIAVGTRPVNSEVEFPSPACPDDRTRTVWDGHAPCVVASPIGGAGILLPTGMIALVPRIIDSLFERDAVCAEAKAPIKITRRASTGTKSISRSMTATRLGKVCSVFVAKAYPSNGIPRPARRHQWRTARKCPRGSARMERCCSDRRLPTCRNDWAAPSQTASP